jgi:hypothetical protein
VVPAVIVRRASSLVHMHNRHKDINNKWEDYQDQEEMAAAVV